MVYSKTFVERASKKVHHVKIDVTQDLVSKWAPEARFIVTFVTCHGELVADSLALDVIEYMNNKVIAFSVIQNTTL